MKLSISIEGMCGLTWPKWKLLAAEIEQMGFAGIFISDHFTMRDPPDMDSLEFVVSLTYLASQSQTIHFGSLVSPLSFRDPIMLARQAMALDDLSGGRMILGVGAGWMAREHKMFGYPLGDVTTRMDRLEEGLEVITRLIRSDDPVTFTGRFYQLQEAHLLPRPQRPTPILVGGNGPKRTLPLVARYADIWNCQLPSLELFRERSSLLDGLIQKTGRQTSDVKRTIMLPVICWNNPADLERIASGYRQAFPDFGSLPTDAIIGYARDNFLAITGAPESVIEQLRAYEAAGAEEIMIQHFLVDHLEGLGIIAKHVLPHFMA
jgi:alkanesulfonate monooxygenase SsuD/methylene tetrahydromethanopterin reductase-like flavin-dependent oxidoreductase (luciferase family)